MLVGDTIARRRRTGIQRVVVQAARALAGQGRFDLVRWDPLEGRLRFLDAVELDQMFGPGAWPEGLELRPEARNVGRPFRELLPDPASAWLLAPEISWHERHGTDYLARAMAHCRAWGGRTAAIFYDLIPIRNPVYGGAAAQHEAYLAELLHTDLIVPISRASGLELAELWRERGVSPVPSIEPVLLPEGGVGGPANPGAAEDPRSGRTIVLFGTVEPRKRQVEAIEAMAAARTRSPEAARWRMVVIGGVHPAVTKAFKAQVDRHDWLTHHDFVSDQALAETLAAADFTVFASDDEGYGLPISESLAAGAPCLCADFGSMAEIAAGGGCLTVDVRDSAALEGAIIRLCEDADLRERLRGEIRARSFRSWADYARELTAMMAAQPAANGSDPVRLETNPSSDDAGFHRAATADVVGFPNVKGRDAFVAEAARRQWPALLPDLAVGAEADRIAADLGRARFRRRRLAERERGFAAARRSMPVAGAARPLFLRVLISTFNRRDFVVANAKWILKKVFADAPAEVELVVVDGGSTDGTVEMLYGLRDANLKVIEGPANVGMLAGLREAAREPGAEYVWLVGDDDFIDPAAFRRVLADLRAHAGIPFAFTNFAVYHRAALSPADIPERLLLEGRPVASDVAPSGLMTVREAAAQTDNLFTAIYAIVWRADLLSAAYERAFDGEPFTSLAEAIPCTEFILGECGDCDALWRAEPGIVGNAHNSWSRHRLNWHGLIMPLALRLARQAGVDPVRLQTFADTHRLLLDEARRSFQDAAQ
jgi:glycosyltransferase involved in cell wall biosynthesis